MAKLRNPDEIKFPSAPRDNTRAPAQGFPEQFSNPYLSATTADDLLAMQAWEDDRRKMDRMAPRYPLDLSSVPILGEMQPDYRASAMAALESGVPAEDALREAEDQRSMGMVMGASGGVPGPRLGILSPQQIQALKSTLRSGILRSRYGGQDAAEMVAERLGNWEGYVSESHIPTIRTKVIDPALQAGRKELMNPDQVFDYKVPGWSENSRDMSKAVNKNLSGTTHEGLLYNAKRREDIPSIRSVDIGNAGSGGYLATSPNVSNSHGDIISAMDIRSQSPIVVDRGLTDDIGYLDSWLRAPSMHGIDPIRVPQIMREISGDASNWYWMNGADAVWHPTTRPLSEPSGVAMDVMIPPQELDRIKHVGYAVPVEPHPDMRGASKYNLFRGGAEPGDVPARLNTYVPPKPALHNAPVIYDRFGRRINPDGSLFNP